MAKCDEGYLCEVCGKPVEKISESSLYLQYVIGWVDPATLQMQRDSHLNCQPTLAQFIEHPDFKPVVAEGDFCRDELDPEFVQHRVAVVSRGFARLRELQRKRQGLNVDQYPLPEVVERWQQTN